MLRYNELGAIWEIDFHIVVSVECEIPVLSLSLLFLGASKVCQKYL